MSERDLQSEWSELLLDALARAGVRDVVVSPGSRSTPFVLAASRQPELRCWDVIDERSAAFFAVGQAKANGVPSLLLCTSGSAGTHYFPAIAEAALSFTPLLILTADRPLDQQGCGAPQTLDQVKLFGDHVRGFFELGLADGSPDALRALRRTAAQAAHLSRWPTPGPVHLNARARKPLEPRPSADEGERQVARRIRALRAEGPPRVHPPEVAPSRAALDRLAERLREAERPLVVAGPGPLRQGVARPAMAELLGRSGAVLLREAASQLRARSIPGIDAFDVLVETRSFREGAAPDLVLQLGSAPTSAALASYLAAQARVERWVVSPHGWSDPAGAAGDLIVGEVADVAAGLAERLPEGRPAASAWQIRWRHAEEAAQRIIGEAAGGELSEGAVVRIVGQWLEPGSTLFVGNSLAIRELDLFCGGLPFEGPVLCQRGANGIDGLISGAAGAAAAGGRVTLLLGDVSLLHDLGGLWVARQVGSRLTLVVLQNHGGRIFEDLPLARVGPAEAMSHFTTQHDLAFGPAAALYGLAYHRPESAADLRAALSAARASDRCSLIEAVLPPTGLEPLRRRIVGRIESELEARP
ncbi:MAG: 2-succinyl-5-enolpyruvyl-6-hydroxy-3-cyclohexene-1-carboxylic-acid synthase [Myxococcales bacterium]